MNGCEDDDVDVHLLGLGTYLPIRSVLLDCKPSRRRDNFSIKKMLVDSILQMSTLEKYIFVL